jgi:hypothetical protein
VISQYSEQHSHCLVLEQHSIDLLDGELRGLLLLKVHETVALVLAIVRSHLAGQDGAKLRERVVQGLGVDGLVQVLRRQVGKRFTTLNKRAL